MPHVSRKKKSAHENIKIANKARLAQLKKTSALKIIDLNASSEEESESELEDEVFSFGSPNLDDENIALELFKNLFNNENQLNQKKRVYYTGLSPRTKRRKNQQLRKAAIGTAQISKFFISHN
ncbi:hypothetical protein Glove_46g182 [Diversispora epigaea]|uniref:Uncharacterized protein n=1 Tax=Diversispora epigaea TaxID=1348612 RepID=A0A397JQI8_9GLOM|nr:hypothetical protein Glove_46g182 [Diversispora epigaea]